MNQINSNAASTHDTGADNTGTSPFETLGIEPAFDIDTAAVERAWLMASARLHPDRVGTDPVAATQLAAVNAAKATLDDDELRARALLAHLGGASGNDDQSLPDGYLEEVLEVRMAIDMAMGSGDDSEIARLRSDINELNTGRVAQVRELFAKALADGPMADGGRTTLLAELRLQLNAWRYETRMLERLDGADAID